LRHAAILLVLAFMLLVGGCSSKKTVDELREEGKTAFLKKDYKQARKLIGEALNKAPSDRDLLSLMARSYQRDYMLDSALFYFGRMDVLYPRDRETNKQIYLLARDLEDWKSAIDALKVLAETGDGFQVHAAELSYLWKQAGYEYNTWYYAREALKKDSMNGQLYLQGATAAMKMDSTKLALDMINRAIDVIGPDTAFLAAKATYLMMDGQYTKAEAMLRPIAEADTSRLDLQISLAQILANEPSVSKKREALKIYRSLLDRMPDYREGIQSSIDSLEKAIK
jgi:tetratricopeptide (TPR) repeat protein